MSSLPSLPESTEETARLLELVDQLEMEGLALERDTDPAGVHLLFRTAHNLKSLTAYAGLHDLSGRFHRLEDGLDRIRRGREAWTKSWFDTVFEVIDEARRAMGSEDRSGAPAPKLRLPQPAVDPQYGIPLTPALEARIAEAELEGLGIYRIEKLVRNGLGREELDGLPVLEDVAEQGRLLGLWPDYETYRNGPEEQVLRILFASSQSAEALGRILFDPLHGVKAPQPPPADAGAFRFLIVEDDPATSVLLRHILKQHGSCVLARSARQAFALVREAWECQKPFDLISLDLFLPDLGGHAFLRALRKLEGDRNVPLAQWAYVVVNTSSTEAEDIRTSIALGADGYLLKPASREAIEAKVEALRRRRSGGLQWSEMLREDRR